jgi:protein N-terminal amidase
LFLLSYLRPFNSGYVFPTPKDILPYLEEPKTGVTSLFCQELANNLGCFVVIGYPEQLRPDEDRPEGRQGQDGREKVVAANSAIIFGPGGEHIGGYRKTNLFVADLPWAKPGVYTFCRLFPSPFIPVFYTSYFILIFNVSYCSIR